MNLHVIIAGDNHTIDALDVTPDVTICPLPSLDVAVDFGEMMDSWGGGTATALLEPVDEEAKLYRVTQFDPVPVTFTQTSDDSFVLDSLDGEWWIRGTIGDDGLEFEHGGELPRFTSPELKPLHAFFLAHRT